MTRKSSWTLLDDGRLIKHLGYTAFNHKTFVIPQDFYHFFNIKDENTALSLSYQSKKYETNLRWAWAKSPLPLIRIRWSSEFASILKRKFPRWKSLQPNTNPLDMWMVFEKTDTDSLFKVDLIQGDTLESEKMIFEAEVSRILQNLPNKKPEGAKEPKRKKTAVEQITRDSHVHAWVLKNSNGKCECCSKPAPFSKEDGKQYLEIHHIKRLADGGSDTVQNAIAVCPNCHRELHYGARKDVLVEELLEKVSRLEKE